MKINLFSILEWVAWAFMAVFVLFVSVVCFSGAFGLLRYGTGGI